MQTAPEINNFRLRTKKPQYNQADTTSSLDIDVPLQSVILTCKADGARRLIAAAAAPFSLCLNATGVEKLSSSTTARA